MAGNWRTKLKAEKEAALARIMEDGPAILAAGKELAQKAALDELSAIGQVIELPAKYPPERKAFIRTIRLRQNMQVVDRPVQAATSLYYDMTVCIPIQGVKCISRDRPEMGYCIIPFSAILAIDYSYEE